MRPPMPTYDRSVHCYAGLAMKSWHHPLAATGSSTALQDAGATNWTQFEHCWPSLGVSWYLAASWVSFVCATRLSAIAFVEMIAPAITGTPFSNERRHSPFWIELDGFVMRALLEKRHAEKTVACPEGSRRVQALEKAGGTTA